MARKKQKGTAPVALVTVADINSTAVEQYRTIRSNISFSSIDKDIKTVVITSSGPSEGKSTTAANLAVVFANSGKKVLLVDADLRKPTVALTFKVPNADGLSTLLGSRYTTTASCLQESGIENLTILPSGPKPPNPSEMLGSNRMVELMHELEREFDLILFDMPPVATVTDAQILAARTDGTILVVRERQTKKQAVLRAKSLLDIAQANIIGVIYNGANKTDDSNYYYYG
ncbi:MAG: CpsD/CapB family tyrosine-protein kinase [Enterococcus sp.]